MLRRVPYVAVRCLDEVEASGVAFQPSQPSGVVQQFGQLVRQCGNLVDLDGGAQVRVGAENVTTWVGVLFLVSVRLR